MEGTQIFYYEYNGDEFTMYLVDTQEKYITKIPSIYEGLCKNLKACQLRSPIVLEGIINRYGLRWIDFDRL